MIHKLLENTKVVLASQSPRRFQLISMMGIKPLVVPSFVNEPISGKLPHQLVMQNAQAKAAAVAGKLDLNTLVIGADTIVVIDKKILGKPAGFTEAADYLRQLSDRTHQVYTGISIIHQGQSRTAYEKSSVCFARLSSQEIEDYIQTQEPMDKAGAYGIQGFGAQFITGIKGCYFNVMGFPLHCFHRLCLELLS